LIFLEDVPRFIEKIRENGENISKSANVFKAGIGVLIRKFPKIVHVFAMCAAYTMAKLMD